MATMGQRRNRLVTQQVEARGVRDPLVLAAMKLARRELGPPGSPRRSAVMPFDVAEVQGLPDTYPFGV
jgi:hypothetical protein